MDRIVTHSTVGGDGTLVVPLGSAMAGRDVQVTVESLAPAKKASEMSKEEWRAFVIATGGSITDPTFVRHDQGEYEERDTF